MQRSLTFRMVILLMILSLVLFPAKADVTTRLQFFHGEDAVESYQDGDVLSLMYDEKVYFFFDNGINFIPAIDMGGGNFLSLFEYEFPAALPSLVKDQETFSLGRLHMDGFESWELLIGEGDRDEGYYMFTDPISLSGSFDQEIIIEKDPEDNPCRVDRLYLIRTGNEFYVASFYANYNLSSGITAPEPSIMRDIQEDLLAHAGMTPPYSTIVDIRYDVPVGTMIDGEESSNAHRTSGILKTSVKNRPESTSVSTAVRTTSPELTNIPSPAPTHTPLLLENRTPVPTVEEIPASETVVTPTTTLEPTATPTVTPTSTPEPTVTPTVTPTSTPEPTATPTVTPTSTPEPTATPTVTPTSTPEPTATPTVTPTSTPEPTATPTITPTSTPESTATPTVLPTSTPEPTATPTVPATSTPEPSVSPTDTPLPTATKYERLEINADTIILEGMIMDSDTPTPTPSALDSADGYRTGTSFYESILNRMKGLNPTLLLMMGLLLLLTILLLVLLLRGRRKNAAPDDTQTRQRFFRLTEVDQRMKREPEPAWKNHISLEEICVQFRNFAASRLHLYYSPELIRFFIASFAASRLTILQGISGTGKTSLAYAFGKFVENPTTIIPVQPSWRDRSDLLGYFNEFTKRFNETELLTKIYEAQYSDHIYLSVLDEMNIARVEYYFAEFLSILEMPSPEEWIIQIVPDQWKMDPALLDQGKLRLPDNMWYVGTANNDDSTFAISDKVYDRAMILDIDSKAEAFDAPDTPSLCLSSKTFTRLLAESREKYHLSEENLKKIHDLDNYLIQHLRITFGNRIMNQMRVFIPALIACGGTEMEGIDFLICKKVLRKLEAQNPAFIREEIDALCAYIIRLFGQNEMKISLEYLYRLKRMG